MRRSVCHSLAGAVGAGAVLLTLAPTTSQAQYNYTPLSVPGAAETLAYGIDGNNIVGWYINGSGDQGFLYNGSTYTTLNVPGAESAFAYGISGNNIVGWYYNGTSDQAFLYNGSTYTTLSVPGAESTYAYGVSGTNIVGYYYNGTNYEGFLYNGGNFTTLRVPGEVGTYAYGISGNNIVGSYEMGSGYVNGFLYNGSTYTTLSPPGAQYTTASGISGTNIVGSYGYETPDGGMSYQGFLYNGSTYTTLSVPDSILNLPGVETYPYGISGNNIVGDCQAANTTSAAFLATPIPEPSTWGLVSLGLPASLVFRRRKKCPVQPSATCYWSVRWATTASNSGRRPILAP